MSSKTKNRSKSAKPGRISHAEAEHLLSEALRAEPKDLKVPISLRLDGDVYLELKRRAEEGVAQGKYQAYLNLILRHYLFGERLESASKTRKRRA